MKTNQSNKRNMEAANILGELKSPRYGPPAKKRKRVLNPNYIGTDEFLFVVDSDVVLDTINNNSHFDTSNVERLHTSLKMYCLSVFNIDEVIADDPLLRSICADEKNHFIDSRYELFKFSKGNTRSVNGLHKKANDFKYLVRCCGSLLKALNLEAYPFSKIMRFINFNCPNLNELILQFKQIKDQDFKNVFSNLTHLEVLRINWQCENLNLPLTLVESLEQVGGTLKELCLSRNQNKDHLCLPDSFVSVFPQLITLKKLNIINFEPSQLLLQSISEIKNLVHLRFMCSWLNNDPVFDKQINMYPIGNLKNLETFSINFDCGITDEFLIILCDNAKNLRRLDIIGKNITDNGMIALDNLKELESLILNLNESEENVFITDQSIQSFAHEKLEYLHLSNCIKITNKSVLKLAETLPNLNNLYVRNTNITFEVAREMLQLTNHHEKQLFVYVSFEDCEDLFNLLALSGVFFKSNFNTCKYIDILF